MPCRGHLSFLMINTSVFSCSYISDFTSINILSQALEAKGDSPHIFLLKDTVSVKPGLWQFLRQKAYTSPSWQHNLHHVLS